MLHTETNGEIDEVPMVLGGSFFSDKELPGDIEATLVFPEDTPDELCWRFFTMWGSKRDAWKEQFRIDYYPTLPGGNDFTLWFSYLGPKTAEAKGLNAKDLRGTLELETW
jgi:hypothetical protein